MVSKKRLEPPKARKKNKKIKVHGLVVNDDYSWLRDDNWQEVLRNPSICLLYTSPSPRDQRGSRMPG